MFLGVGVEGICKNLLFLGGRGVVFLDMGVGVDGGLIILGLGVLVVFFLICGRFSLVFIKLVLLMLVFCGF